MAEKATQTTETATLEGVLTALGELADEFDSLGGKLAEIEQAARQPVERGRTDGLSALWSEVAELRTLIEAHLEVCPGAPGEKRV